MDREFLALRNPVERTQRPLYERFGTAQQTRPRLLRPIQIGRRRSDIGFDAHDALMDLKNL